MSGTSRNRSWIAVALIPLAALTVGCAGDGTGLDQFGNPLSADKAELGPTLSSIQRNVFTPICTQCHTGAAGPLGLALDEGASRDDLVNVPSVEHTELLLVSPGDAEASYLVWKVEGRADITGGRMPLGLPPLSEDEIAAIRGWIEQGAEDN
jgi:hypothetical protein